MVSHPQVTSRLRRASAALRLFFNRWRARLIDWLFGRSWLVLLAALAGCADVHTAEVADDGTAAEAQAAPPHDLYFSDEIPDADRRAWNYSSNDWFWKVGSWYFRFRPEPMPDDACGILVRLGPTARVTAGQCRAVIEYDVFEPCFAKLAYSTVLGIEADPSSCGVTADDAAAVVERWGLPWVITVLPPKAQL